MKLSGKDIFQRSRSKKCYNFPLNAHHGGLSTQPVHFSGFLNIPYFHSLINKCYQYEDFCTSSNLEILQQTEEVSRHTGLQIIFQNLLDMMSRKNKIPSDIYENLSDINFFKNSNKFQLLLRNISPLVYKSQIYTIRY